jgi:hypothetical protein
MKLNHSTAASGATVIASSAMLTAIRILLAASLIDRACLFASVPLVEGHSTLLK